MLAYEVFDPKNTSPCVKYCHLSLYLYLLRCEYYIVIIPFPVFQYGKYGVALAQLRKTSNEAVTTILDYEVFDPKNTSLCVNIVIYRFIYIYYVADIIL